MPELPPSAVPCHCEKERIATATSIRQTIETWRDLSPSQRRPLFTAINHAEAILTTNRHLLTGCAPWSCAGLNRALWPNGEPALSLKADPFRNMVTCLRTVMIRLGTHADSGYGRNKLSPAWEALHKALPTDEYRKGLLRFFRFLTLEGITPDTITGSPWADIPERYGPYTTCYNRFVRWRKLGVWDKIFEAVSKAYKGNGQMVDASSIRVHQHAANGKSRSGRCQRQSIHAEAHGRPGP